MKGIDNRSIKHSRLESLLSKLMRDQGFNVIQEPQEQPRIDIIAQKGKDVLLMELKSYDPSVHLGFDSLAQVLSVSKSYSSRFLGLKVQPIVVGTFSVSETVRELAKDAGIKLIPINEVTETKILEALRPLIVNPPGT